MAGPEHITAPQTWARFAGFCYLLVALIAMYALMGVLEPLRASGDAAAAVAAAGMQFRLAIVGVVVILVLDVLVAWAFVLLFKPANAALSWLSALFRLMYVFVHGAVLTNLVMVLTAPDDAIGTLIESYFAGFELSLIFFGVHLVLLGYLIIRSRLLPLLIGVALILAGLGYIADTVAGMLLQNANAYKPMVEPFMIGASLIGEFGLLLWLLIRGVSLERWRALTA
ncbi:MAG: DUF4386 domain-containing protein [Hyphomonadaceae bacterium]